MGGGTAANVEMGQDGSFSGQVPAAFSYRDINATDGDPCATSASRDKAPIDISGSVDYGQKTVAVVIQWLTGPIEIELRQIEN